MENKLIARVQEIIENNGGQEFADNVLEYGCVSGVVTELITYSQTHTWFDEYYEEIMDLRDEFEAYYGDKVLIDGDIKNNFAWWSFEAVVAKLEYNI